MGTFLIIEPILLLIALELCIPHLSATMKFSLETWIYSDMMACIFFLKFCQCICTYLAAFFHLIKVLKKEEKINLVHDLSTPPTWPGSCPLL